MRRRLLFALVVVVTLLALVYTVEDWRGARAWAATRRQLESKGESFDLATYLTPPMPDDQNLAMAPLFARMFRYQVDPQTRALTFAPDSPPEPTRRLVEEMPLGRGENGSAVPRGLTAWAEAGRLDLSQWQQYYRQRADFPRAAAPQTPADDVRLALTRYSSVLDELAARPPRAP